jgi:hypothetical protein
VFSRREERELRQLLILCCEKPSAALDDWLIDKSPGAAPILTPYSSLAQQNTTKHTHSPSSTLRLHSSLFLSPCAVFLYYPLKGATEKLWFTRKTQTRLRFVSPRGTRRIPLFLFSSQDAYLPTREIAHACTHYDMVHIFLSRLLKKATLSAVSWGTKQLFGRNAVLAAGQNSITKSHPDASEVPPRDIWWIQSHVLLLWVYIFIF